MSSHSAPLAFSVHSSLSKSQEGPERPDDLSSKSSTIPKNSKTPLGLLEKSPLFHVRDAPNFPHTGPVQRLEDIKYFEVESILRELENPRWLNKVARLCREHLTAFEGNSVPTPIAEYKFQSLSDGSTLTSISVAKSKKLCLCIDNKPASANELNMLLEERDCKSTLRAPGKSECKCYVPTTATIFIPAHSKIEFIPQALRYELGFMNGDNFSGSDLKCLTRESQPCDTWKLTNDHTAAAKQLVDLDAAITREELKLKVHLGQPGLVGSVANAATSVASKSQKAQTIQAANIQAAQVGQAAIEAVTQTRTMETRVAVLKAIRHQFAEKQYLLRYLESRQRETFSCIGAHTTHAAFLTMYFKTEQDLNAAKDVRILKCTEDFKLKGRYTSPVLISDI